MATPKIKKTQRDNHNISFVTTELERNYSKENFDQIKKYIIDNANSFKCTVCYNKIICNPSFHPALRVLTCVDCTTQFTNFLFERRENSFNNNDENCLWCTKKSQKFYCYSCTATFCQACIERNFNENFVKNISLTWRCFICEPSQLWKHRAIATKIHEYLKERKNSPIMNSSNLHFKKTKRNRQVVPLENLIEKNSSLRLEPQKTSKNNLNVRLENNFLQEFYSSINEALEEMRREALQINTQVENFSKKISSRLKIQELDDVEKTFNKLSEFSKQVSENFRYISNRSKSVKTSLLKKYNLNNEKVESPNETETLTRSNSDRNTLKMQKSRDDEFSNEIQVVSEPAQKFQISSDSPNQKISQVPKIDSKFSNSKIPQIEDVPSSEEMFDINSINKTSEPEVFNGENESVSIKNEINSSENWSLKSVLAQNYEENGYRDELCKSPSSDEEIIVLKPKNNKKLSLSTKKTVSSDGNDTFAILYDEVQNWLSDNSKKEGENASKSKRNSGENCVSSALTIKSVNQDAKILTKKPEVGQNSNDFASALNSPLNLDEFEPRNETIQKLVSEKIDDEPSSGELFESETKRTSQVEKKISANDLKFEPSSKIQNKNLSETNNENFISKDENVENEEPNKLIASNGSKLIDSTSKKLSNDLDKESRWEMGSKLSESSVSTCSFTSNIIQDDINKNVEINKNIFSAETLILNDGIKQEQTTNDLSETLFEKSYSPGLNLSMESFHIKSESPSQNESNLSKTDKIFSEGDVVGNQEISNENDGLNVTLSDSFNQIEANPKIDNLTPVDEQNVVLENIKKMSVKQEFDDCASLFSNETWILSDDLTRKTADERIQEDFQDDLTQDLMKFEKNQEIREPFITINEPVEGSSEKADSDATIDYSPHSSIDLLETSEKIALNNSTQQFSDTSSYCESDRENAHLCLQFPSSDATDTDSVNETNSNESDDENSTDNYLVPVSTKLNEGITINGVTVLPCYLSDEQIFDDSSISSSKSSNKKETQDDKLKLRPIVDLSDSKKLVENWLKKHETYFDKEAAEIDRLTNLDTLKRTLVITENAPENLKFDSKRRKKRCDGNQFDESGSDISRLSINSLSDDRSGDSDIVFEEAERLQSSPDISEGFFNSSDDGNEENENESEKSKPEKLKNEGNEKLDEDFDVSREKSWRDDPLLRQNLNLSDSEKEIYEKNVNPKEKEEKTKGKRRHSELSDSSDGDIIKIQNSSEDISSEDEVQFISETKASISIAGNKKRRNIKEVISDDALNEATKEAERKEEERKKRLTQKQQTLDTILSQSLINEEETGFVLDIDKRTQEPLVSIPPRIVENLKPHQKKGIKFMWDVCFESVEKAITEPGTGCIIAHCMGLGKTRQIVTLSHILLTNKHLNEHFKKILIICPLSVVHNWKNEFNITLCGLKPIRVKDLSPKLKLEKRIAEIRLWEKNGGVLIIGYDTFTALVTNKRVTPTQQNELREALIDPGPNLVVCDEGHLLKEEKTVRFQSIDEIKTSRRIILTGTPLQNNLRELYQMVNFVKPNLLGTLQEFNNRFTNPITNGQFTDSSPEDISLMRRRSHVLHKTLRTTVQRFQSDILDKYIPDKLDYIVYTQLCPLQQKLYQHYLDMSGEQTRNMLFKAYHTFSNIWTHPGLLILRQHVKNKNRLSVAEICAIGEPDGNSSAPNSNSGTLGTPNGKPSTSKRRQTCFEHLDEDDKIANEINFEWFQDLIPSDLLSSLDYSPKFQILFSIISECVALGDKLLVFSHFIIELDLIESFINRIHKSWVRDTHYFRMDGDTDNDLRLKYCNKFNNEKNSDAKVFLISYKVGGLGLNFYSANRVVLMDVSWNPTYDTQSIFRAYRFGQKKKVTSYRLVSIGTMEEVVCGRSITKTAVSERVVDEKQVTRAFKGEDLQKMLELNTDYGSRPTLDVPEDRLLGKLITKFNPILFKYMPHQKLLEVLPHEELDEDELKRAWEEFNNELKAAELQQQIAQLPALPTLNQYPYNFYPENQIPAHQSTNVPFGKSANFYPSPSTSIAPAALSFQTAHIGTCGPKMYGDPKITSTLPQESFGSVESTLNKNSARVYDILNKRRSTDNSELRIHSVEVVNPGNISSGQNTSGCANNTSWNTTKPISNTAQNSTPRQTPSSTNQAKKSTENMTEKNQNYHQEKPNSGCSSFQNVPTIVTTSNNPIETIPTVKKVLNRSKNYQKQMTPPPNPHFFGEIKTTLDLTDAVRNATVVYDKTGRNRQTIDLTTRHDQGNKSSTSRSDRDCNFTNNSDSNFRRLDETSAREENRTGNFKEMHSKDLNDNFRETEGRHLSKSSKSSEEFHKNDLSRYQHFSPKSFQNRNHYRDRDRDRGLYRGNRNFQRNRSYNYRHYYDPHFYRYKRNRDPYYDNYYDRNYDYYQDRYRDPS